MSDDTATISIHAAREGSDLAYGVVITRLTISIHAAREGGDLCISIAGRCTLSFQSTPPVKAATMEFYMACPFLVISIHAAREGGDRNQTGLYAAV